MSSYTPAVVVLNQSNMNPAAANRQPKKMRRLTHTARRVGRIAVEMVFFLGVGGAMVAGTLLLR